MRSGEIWSYKDKKTPLRIQLMTKLHKDLWKTENLTPEHNCYFSADIEEDTPEGFWGKNGILPEFIIRDFFEKEWK